MAKANLSSLIHELRERIAASSSSPTPNNSSDDDALEVRFRTVLPNLLHVCVLPSSTSSGTYNSDLFLLLLPLHLLHLLHLNNECNVTQSYLLILLSLPMQTTREK